MHLEAATASSDSESEFAMEVLCLNGNSVTVNPEEGLETAKVIVAKAVGRSRPVERSFRSSTTPWICHAMPSWTKRSLDG